MEVHTEQQCFGCCMLEPGHNHESEAERSTPWQACTGGVFLLREAAGVWPRDCAALLALLDAAYAARWYPHYSHVVSVITHETPAILESLGDHAAAFKNLKVVQECQPRDKGVPLGGPASPVPAEPEPDGEWLESLLSPLFASRHDPAEGVRALAHVNWRRAVGYCGKSMLASAAARVAAYLVSPEMTATHELRAASAVATGEFLISLTQEAVRPHVAPLVGTLRQRMHDAHWSVRLAACNALHDIAAAFPIELAKLQPDDIGAAVVGELLVIAGRDPISGVREAAASAAGVFASTRRGHPREELKGPFLSRCRELLAAVEQEPIPDGLTRESVCGAAEIQAHNNDMEVHTEQQCFGCCMLEPGHNHESEAERSTPWQACTGGVFLLREAAGVWPRDCAALLALLDAAYAARWYPHYSHVVSVITHETPAILESLGDHAAAFKNLKVVQECQPRDK
eukprot:m51a1_g620 hypothetical protein (456) ;mRNA; r:113423-116222